MKFKNSFFFCENIPKKKAFYNKSIKIHKLLIEHTEKIINN